MSLLKVVSCFPNIIAGAVEHNTNEIIQAIEQLDQQDTDVLLFPELVVTGAGLGHLFYDCHLLQSAQAALFEILKNTERVKTPIILSLPLLHKNQLLSVSAIIYEGKLCAFVPSQNHSSPFTPYVPQENEVIRLKNQEVPFSDHFLFSFACGFGFSVLPCPNLEKLPLAEAHLVQNGAKAILSPCAYPAFPNQKSTFLSTIYNRGKTLHVPLVFCNGGKGESTSRFVNLTFSAFSSSCVHGHFQYTHSTVFHEMEIPLMPLLNSFDANQSVKTISFSREKNPLTKLASGLSKTPFLPADEALESYYSTLFDLQVISLANRMKSIGITQLVMGVSGGLDSTLALLVATKALAQLGLSATNITAITMPGLGTSNKTLSNAVLLLRKLGLDERTIPIEGAVLRHFEDIGHDKSNKNTTYENTQARERTQILFDIANSKNALVVGTGDLSEIALGWCTFGGDHLASFGVNACLTKDMVRGVVSMLSKTLFSEIESLLVDVLNTPVSPELLPCDEGSIVQKTEEILGAYAYHDFFLYYTICSPLSPKELLLYAQSAFSEVELTTLKRHLITFYRRFYSSQFKRACSTEFASITELGAALKSYVFPSDLSKEFVQEKIVSLS